MSIEIGRMPRYEEVLAIEFEARRMRAEVLADGARAVGRAVARLAGRIAGREPRPVRA